MGDQIRFELALGSAYTDTVMEQLPREPRHYVRGADRVCLTLEMDFVGNFW